MHSPSGAGGPLEPREFHRIIYTPPTVVSLDQYVVLVKSDREDTKHWGPSVATVLFK